MIKNTILALLLGTTLGVQAQEKMSPELLWSLKRVSANGISGNGKYLFYSSKSIDWKTEKSTVHRYRIALEDGSNKEWTTDAGKTVTQRYEHAWYAYYDNLLFESTDEGATWTEI